MKENDWVAHHCGGGQHLDGLGVLGHDLCCRTWEVEIEQLVGDTHQRKMASPAAWQTAHSAALPWATIALCVGLVAAVITGVLVLNGASNRWAMIVACAGLVAITVVALLMLCVAVETVRG